MRKGIFRSDPFSVSFVYNRLSLSTLPLAVLAVLLAGTWPALLGNSWWKRKELDEMRTYHTYWFFYLVAPRLSGTARATPTPYVTKLFWLRYVMILTFFLMCTVAKHWPEHSGQADDGQPEIRQGLLPWPPVNDKPYPLEKMGRRFPFLFSILEFSP